MTTKDKDQLVQLPVKLPKDLREAFVDACRRNDTNASREIRNFIRDYLKRYGQTDLDL